MNKNFEVKNSTYKGLYGFHKYWGKKPLEINELLISMLSKKNEIVLDPFMGGGLVSRVVLKNSRKFIGIDINPVSQDLANLLINLPDYNIFLENFNKIQKRVKNKINSSYIYKKNLVTHYLWKKGKTLCREKTLKFSPHRST